MNATRNTNDPHPYVNVLHGTREPGGTVYLPRAHYDDTASDSAAPTASESEGAVKRRTEP